MRLFSTFLMCAGGLPFPAIVALPFLHRYPGFDDLLQRRASYSVVAADGGSTATQATVTLPPTTVTDVEHKTVTATATYLVVNPEPISPCTTDQPKTSNATPSAQSSAPHAPSSSVAVTNQTPLPASASTPSTPTLTKPGSSVSVSSISSTLSSSSVPALPPPAIPTYPAVISVQTPPSAPSVATTLPNSVPSAEPSTSPTASISSLSSAAAVSTPASTGMVTVKPSASTPKSANSPVSPSAIAPTASGPTTAVAQTDQSSAVAATPWRPSQPVAVSSATQAPSASLLVSSGPIPSTTATRVTSTGVVSGPVVTFTFSSSLALSVTSEVTAPPSQETMSTKTYDNGQWHTTYAHWNATSGHQ